MNLNILMFCLCSYCDTDHMLYWGKGNTLNKVKKGGKMKKGKEIIKL
jgi:hypothetical protein